MNVKNAMSGIEYVGNVQSNLEECGGSRSIVTLSNQEEYLGNLSEHLLLACFVLGDTQRQPP
jgi:hypothetical protein